MKTKRTKKYSSRNNSKAKQRELQKEEGYFDGRFAPKVERPKNKYKRKKKYKDDYTS